MKNVKSGPMPLACTTMAGSRPILAASCSAAPSARARSLAVPNGTGRVNDTCTRPSPVVSPYGRTTAGCSLRWRSLGRWAGPCARSDSAPPGRPAVSRISVAGLK